MRIPIAERARVSRQCVVSLELADPKSSVNMIGGQSREIQVNLDLIILVMINLVMV